MRARASSASGDETLEVIGVSGGERKHLTILFADLVGSTALCQRLDAEEVHGLIDAWLQAMSDEIHRYGGLINQFSGDSVMALFGAPASYEDAPQRACHAALAMQRQVQELAVRRGVPLVMRVGIDTGPAFVGQLGNDLRPEYAALGHHSNRAKRVQEAAEPGAVMVSEETQRLVGPYFQLTGGGEFQAKGIAQPLMLYRLVSSRGRRARLDATLPRSAAGLVGRQREIAVLRQHLDGVRAGRPQYLRLDGEAGVGKSRLAADLKRMAAEEGVCVWEGRALPYEEQQAGALFADVIRRACGVGEGDTAVRARQKIEPLAAPLGADRHFLEALLAIGDAGQLDDIGPQERRAGMFDAVQQLVREQAARAPLVLLLDDFHWADTLSAELTEILVHRADGLPLLLCVVTRGAEINLPSASRFTTVSLSALSSTETRRLIGQLLPRLEGEPGPGLADWMHRLSGGNPLFIEELVQALLAGGALTPATGGWRIQGDYQQLDLPATLHDLIASRIDALPPDLKDVLQRAAVIGDEFGLGLLEQVTGNPRTSALVRSLQQCDLIVEIEGAPGPTCRFKHGLTWRVAYDMLPRGRRTPIHEQVGRLIEQTHAADLEPHCVMLAHHYSRSHDHQRAVRFLRRAAEQARAAYANDVAIGYLTRALELGAAILAPAEKVRLLLERGELRGQVLDRDSAIADFDTAAALARQDSDPATEARAWLGKGNAYAHQYRFAEALVWLDRALTTAAAADCRREMIEVLIRKGLVLGEQAERDIAGAMACLQEALQRSLQLDDRRLEIQALIHLATVHYNRYEPGAALRTLEECIERCEEIGDRASLGLALLNQGRAYLATGAALPAIEVNERLRGLLLRIGDKRRLAHCVSNLGLAWQLRGEETGNVECFHRARAYYEDALLRFRELGGTDLVRMTLIMLRALHARLGDMRKVIEVLTQLIPLVRQDGSSEQAAELFAELGEACVREGDGGGAKAAFADAAKLYVDCAMYEKVRGCLAQLEKCAGSD